GAVENAKIGIEMKRIKIGGGNYRVPKPIEEERDEKKALSSIVKVADEKASAKTMPEKLAEIIIDTNNKVGEVIKKKENVLKEGEANMSFASFLNRK
ncbi:4493_t:CDS:1, partial [Paraglomus occultum]